MELIWLQEETSIHILGIYFMQHKFLACAFRDDIAMGHIIHNFELSQSKYEHYHP